MTDCDVSIPIDMGLYPKLDGIVEKSFVRNNNLHIILLKPLTKVIVTRRLEYDKFRKELEKRLIEKEIEKETIKNILNFVDCSHEFIYPITDANNSLFYTNAAENVNSDITPSDLSDLSDLSEKTLTHEKIQIVNISECLKLHSGPVQVYGNVAGFSNLFKVVISIEGKCECGDSNKIYFNPPLYTLDERDRKCPKCNKFVKINKEKTQYRNAITVYLQDHEKFNHIEKLTCILIDIDSANIKPGEKIKVTGDIHVRPKADKLFLIPKVFSEKVEYDNKEETILNDRDIDAIKKFAILKGNNIIPSLVEMFDQSIIGNSLAKEALLLALVNAGDDLEDIKKTKFRTRTHIVIAGKPGQAKSTLLRKTVNLVPNSRYESVQHSSGKSLTAVVEKDGESTVLNLGPIPNAKGSICALNEIGTMMPDDQMLLLDVMEEGRFTNNKYGSNTLVHSPTTIIASTNFGYLPVFGLGFHNKQTITNRSLPMIEQLLDRFDLIVILEDKENKQDVREYVQKKIYQHNFRVPNYDIFIQKYLEYARKIKVRVSSEALEMIQQYYLKLNENSQKPPSKRKLETIIRICKAVSKLKLKETVDGKDVTEAISFYNLLTWKLNGLSAQIPRDPFEITVEQCINHLKEIKEPISFMQLIINICNENEYISSYLTGSFESINQQNKLVMNKNKKVRKISEVLRQNSSIKVVNKNPIILQFTEQEVILTGSDGSDGSD